jgi:hypothetical protein
MRIRIIDPFWTKHTFLQSKSFVGKTLKPPISTFRDTENSTTRPWSPRINVEPEKVVLQGMASAKVVVDSVAANTSNEYVECAEEGKTASNELSTKCSRPIACVDMGWYFTAECPAQGLSPPPIREITLPTPPTAGELYAEEVVVVGSLTEAKCPFGTNTPCADKVTEAVESLFTLSAAHFMHTLTDDVLAIEYVMVEADFDTPPNTSLETGMHCKLHNTTCTYTLSSCTLESDNSTVRTVSTVSTNPEPRVAMDNDNALLIFTDFSFCADSFVLID